MIDETTFYLVCLVFFLVCVLMAAVVDNAQKRGAAIIDECLGDEHEFLGL